MVFERYTGAVPAAPAAEGEAAAAPAEGGEPRALSKSVTIHLDMDDFSEVKVVRTPPEREDELV